MTATPSQTFSSLCSNPLFSCIVTLYALILIFYPLALKIFLSPVFIITCLLLLFLLRLGSGQQLQIPAETVQIGIKEEKIRENTCTNLDPIDVSSLSSAQNDKWVKSDADSEIQIPEEGKKNSTGEEKNKDTNLDSIEKDSLCLAQIDKCKKSYAGVENDILEEAEKNATGEEKCRDNRDTDVDSVEKDYICLAQIDKWVKSQAELDFESRKHFENSFIEWNVRAPLEVIYEAYEGEEDDEAHEFFPIQSLSMYYPETDSDSSSDGGSRETGGGWDSPESVYWKWEEEDKDGMLIEIALDSNGKHRSGMGFHFEEDNLIEIDISPRGNDTFNTVLV